ncbi:winged helix-turn-helix domain-containing protein [Silvibacterium sp.]|uniref:winged helix-turn-helix domain-containing protein n=1 Tax=Silvibacterium sp. TaxID=1964179 RepID=UPI0039E61406
MPKQVFAFSEYTYDCDTGTLTRRNRNTRLPEKTARLLELLLERANSLVSREELRQKLWPGEEFLDYDQGINVAVNRLRNVLRESSRNPQFLRTIPKRGYSFCGDVRLLPAEAALRSAGIAPAGRASREAAEALRDVHDAPETSSSGKTVPLPAFARNSAIAPPPEILVPQPDAASSSSGTALPAIAQPSEPAPWAVATAVVPSPQLPVDPPQTRHRRTGWLVAGLLLLLIVAGIAGVLLLRRHPDAAHILRLGIAPLRVEGGADAREAAEDFRLQLSDAVSRLPSVQVPAAGAFSTSNATDIPHISSELHLDDLLLGRLSQQGDQYDLKFELVRATDATHLASFEYSGPRKDLPAISDRLQQDIFHYLQSRAATVQTIKGSTNDPQAYELYLQGVYHMLERDPESLNRSIEEFRQATARDPSFAAAYAGTATAYLKLSAYDTSPRDGLLSKAESFAEKAVKLDPLSAQGHAVLGSTAYKQDRDFKRGEAELRKAIQLDPTQATYRDWLSVLFVEEGRFDEALEQLNQAQTNAPFWPSVYAMEGLVGVYARRDPIALRAARRYVDLLPDLPIAHNTMAWVYFETGHYKEAIDEWHQMALLQNNTERAELETRGMEVFRTGGIRAYAELRLDAIRNQRGVGQVNDFMPAEWYACADKREEALNELDHLAAANDAYMLHAGVDPLYDSFHQDPRFLAILSRAGVTIPPSLRNVNSHLCGN